MEKTTFLGNRPARHRRAGSLDLGEETNIAKNSLAKSSVCRHAGPPFARKPHAKSGNRIWTIYLKSTLCFLCHRACRVPGAGSLDLGEKKRPAQDLHESPGLRIWPSAANTKIPRVVPTTSEPDIRRLAGRTGSYRGRQPSIPEHKLDTQKTGTPRNLAGLTTDAVSQVFKDGLANTKSNNTNIK